MGSYPRGHGFESLLQFRSLDNLFHSTLSQFSSLIHSFINEYLAVDSGGHKLMGDIRAVNAAWLNASQRRVGMTTSARG